MSVYTPAPYESGWHVSEAELQRLSKEVALAEWGHSNMRVDMRNSEGRTASAFVELYVRSVPQYYDAENSRGSVRVRHAQFKIVNAPVRPGYRAALNALLVRLVAVRPPQILEPRRSFTPYVYANGLATATYNTENSRRIDFMNSELFNRGKDDDYVSENKEFIVPANSVTKIRKMNLHVPGETNIKVLRVIPPLHGRTRENVTLSITLNVTENDALDILSNSEREKLYDSEVVALKALITSLKKDEIVNFGLVDVLINRNKKQ